MAVFLTFTGNGTGETIDLTLQPPLVAPFTNWLVNALGGSDTVTGLGIADIINAGKGNDSVNAGGGDDTVTGDAGKDTLDGEAGNDSIEGGGGNDDIYGGNGADTLRGDAGKDAVDGENGNDDIAGGAGNDSLTGGADGDTVNGDAGKDTVEGGTGNDRVNGGADDDFVSGGDGDDFVNGGAGNDFLLGGEAVGDNDVFAFNTAGDSSANPERDTIADFNTDRDVIDLRAFNLLAANVQVIQPAAGLVLSSTRTINVDTDKDGKFNDNLIITVSVANALGGLDSLDVLEVPDFIPPFFGGAEILI